MAYYRGSRDSKLKISNAYTMGNLYVDSWFVGDIVGAIQRGQDSRVALDNVYYIRPQKDNGYIDLKLAPNNGFFLKKATVIDYDKFTDKSKWGDFKFSTQENGTIKDATDDNWRMSMAACRY